MVISKSFIGVFQRVYPIHIPLNHNKSLSIPSNHQKKPLSDYKSYPINSFCRRKLRLTNPPSRAAGWPRSLSGLENGNRDGSTGRSNLDAQGMEGRLINNRADWGWMIGSHIHKILATYSFDVSIFLFHVLGYKFIGNVFLFLNYCISHPPTWFNWVVTHVCSQNQ